MNNVRHLQLPVPAHSVDIMEAGRRSTLALRHLPIFHSMISVYRNIIGNRTCSAGGYNYMAQYYMTFTITIITCACKRYKIQA